MYFVVVAAALVTVNNIVLQDKEQIKEDANLAEAKLDGVARDAAPVVLEEAVDALLGDAEDAAGQVEQDLPDAPAVGALVADIGAQLRGVFDEGDGELDVAKGVDDVEVAPVGAGVDDAAAGPCAQDDEVGDADADKGAGGEADGEAARAGPRAADGEAPEGGADEVLRRGDEGENEAVQRKDDVVELDRGREAVVAGGVLAADGGGVVEGEVGEKVRGEAWVSRRVSMSRETERWVEYLGR